jgi:hypothetical protein
MGISNSRGDRHISTRCTKSFADLSIVAFTFVDEEAEKARDLIPKSQPPSSSAAIPRRAARRVANRQMPQAYPPQRGIGKLAAKENARIASLAVEL